jgi:hypothetical protein
LGGISVTPGDASVERGSGVVVLARFDGRLPAEVALVDSSATQPNHHVSLTKTLDDPVFGGSIPEVAGETVYHVEYDGRRTRDFKLTVFEYPSLQRADAELTFPEYTALPPKKFDDIHRISAVEGTLLDYTFQLNKPVASATLIAKDKSSLPLSPDTVRSNVYHTSFALEQSRQYDLLLVDDAGRTNKLPPRFVIDVLKGADVYEPTVDQWQLEKLAMVTTRQRLHWYVPGLPPQYHALLWGQSHDTVESAIAALAAALPPDAAIAVIPEGPYVLAKASAPEMALR